MDALKMSISYHSLDSVSSVIKVFGILQVLGEQDVSSVTELSLRTMMSKKTVYRFLQTMKTLGYVTQEGREDKYALSFRLFELGAKVLEYKTLIEFADAYMSNLGKEIKETLNLGILNDDCNIYYLRCIDAEYNLRVTSRIGRSLPVYCSALGKVMTAWLGDEEIRQFLKQVEFIPFTENTLCDMDSFIGELVKVRELGYAEDNEETELGLCCFAVPIYDRLGHIIAGLSLSLPIVRFQKNSREQLVLQLHKVAAAISEQMGYHGYPFTNY